MISASITFGEAAAWLKIRDGFLIITHRRPDGDALGSAGALAQGLREAGKTAYVLYNPETTPRYMRFVQDYIAPEEYKPDYIIAVDTASYELFPKDDEHYGVVSLCIDHHPSNTMYAEKTCLYGSRASCGEIVYEILLVLIGKISAKCAGHLYAAVSTDTGCFAFANTTSNTLRVASLLVESGAPHTQLNKLLFRTKSRSRVKIEGMIFSGLEYHFGGTVAISTITKKMVDSIGAVEDDLDDIASIPGSVEGVLVGITIREMTSDHDCKISVRTTQTVDAHAICERYSGGGHAMAAGCVIKKTAKEVKRSLLETMKDFIPQEARN